MIRAAAEKVTSHDAIDLPATSRRRIIVTLGWRSAA